jgi:hypothetical protein
MAALGQKRTFKLVVANYWNGVGTCQGISSQPLKTGSFAMHTPKKIGRPTANGNGPTFYTHTVAEPQATYKSRITPYEEKALPGRSRVGHVQ